MGLSPRGRGNRRVVAPLVRVGGSIPRVGGGTREWGDPFEPSHGLSPRGRGNRRVVAPLVRVGGSIPRVGGGTREWGDPFEPSHGLSPRGRGNHQQGRVLERLGRSIPAWAGEPHQRHTRNRLPWVYPRVGGGTPLSPQRRCRCSGLSPRGRGNRHGLLDRPRRRGSIPAWAGEPTLSGGTPAERAVYPRVGGGTWTVPPPPFGVTGLSPRGRGNRRGAA